MPAEMIPVMIPVAALAVMLVGGVAYHQRLDRDTLPSGAQAPQGLPRVPDPIPHRDRLRSALIFGALLAAQARIQFEIRRGPRALQGLPVRRHDGSGGTWPVEYSRSVVNTGEIMRVDPSATLAPSSVVSVAPRPLSGPITIGSPLERALRAGATLEATGEWSPEEAARELAPPVTLADLDAIEVKVVARVARAMLKMHDECEAFLRSLEEVPA